MIFCDLGTAQTRIGVDHRESCDSLSKPKQALRALPPSSRFEGRYTILPSTIERTILRLVTL